jgi:glycosyltransferase involved in cell wall biosynthesis
VICTRDRADLIGQAVVSIVDCDHDGIELHVMDQSTDDSTQRVVRTLAAQHAEHTTIVYHHLDVAGLSRAYNAGFRGHDKSDRGLHGRRRDRAWGLDSGNRACLRH